MQKNNKDQKLQKCQNKQEISQGKILFDDNETCYEDNINLIPNDEKMQRILKRDQKLNNSINQQYFMESKKKSFIISLGLLLMTLLLSVNFFYKNLLTYLVVQYKILEVEKHGKGSQFQEIKNINRIQYVQKKKSYGKQQITKFFCPQKEGVFHVLINQDENHLSQFPSLPDDRIKQIDLCQIPILNNNHLDDFIERWNKKFTSTQIFLQSINSKKQKQSLLILLKLYFSGGTYLNITVPYSKVYQRCWQQILIGFDTVFTEYTEINDKNIAVPKLDKMLKVRFPYSPQIKTMIQKIISNEDWLDDCRNRQCVIVKCFQ